MSGRELWKSDGTEAGTVLVKDICPGSRRLDSRLPDERGRNALLRGQRRDAAATSSGRATARRPAPSSSRTSSRGARLVSCSPDERGRDALLRGRRRRRSGNELWKSDGTEAGTVLVKDIRPGSGSSSSRATLTNVNGTLFFTRRRRRQRRCELWKSDGTEAGTVLVKDINRRHRQLAFLGLTNVDGTLFFTADDGTSGDELWKSDGTEAGTVLVKDICPGSGSSYPALPDERGRDALLRADDGTNGRELWKSDGTEAGTVLVKDIHPGSSGSAPDFLTNVSGTLFFGPTTDASGDASSGRATARPPAPSWSRTSVPGSGSSRPGPDERERHALLPRQRRDERPGALEERRHGGGHRARRRHHGGLGRKRTPSASPWSATRSSSPPSARTSAASSGCFPSPSPMRPCSASRALARSRRSRGEGAGQSRHTKVVSVEPHLDRVRTRSLPEFAR